MLVHQSQGTVVVLEGRLVGVHLACLVGRQLGVIKVQVWVSCLLKVRQQCWNFGMAAQLI